MTTDDPATADAPTHRSVPRNEHLQNLGFRLTEPDSTEAIERLLEACDLEALPEPDLEVFSPSRYYCAETRAGGIAGCVGWNRFEDAAVMHSLGVAPSSRRSGIGASLFATAVGQIMDEAPVEAIYLRTRQAVGYFSRFGFKRVETDAIPEPVATHPVYDVGDPGATTMVRRYRDGLQRGLDQCAFRLIHNTTAENLLPAGAVFFFDQSGSRVEAGYRGSPVERGHLIGSIEDGRLRFLWHQYTEEGNLLQGDGEIHVDELDDGRLELREKLGDDPGEMLLREV
ncbi:MAG: GNAT family N-acetyltransferase [Bradymonadaceae bacterium]